ncbi:DUF4123 domain-containing protein [Achromobacter deleyi]|uniref:DUF4123 domain-containing protein n=1 Tax=Achromobacter deleyi TaxID=1353891 RepID=A0A7T4E188_9BURK|nr:DUF4123 domain-containing protein [Achromobacter deleyi]QQB33278.1 DUF4123 domain-containing protein [Achromobacter deleyi]
MDGVSHTDTFASGVALAETLQQLALSMGEARCHLLIDPLLRDPVEDEDWQGLGEALAARATAIRLAHPDIDPRVWPRLITLDLTRPRDADISRTAAEMAIRDWHSESLAQGRGRRIGGWIFGVTDVIAMARHLGRSLLQESPGGGRRLFRLHDPAVIDLVWRMASHGQKADLLGPANLWVNIDRWGRLARYASEAPRSGATVQLDAEQWRLAALLGAVNRAWRVVAERPDAVSEEALDQVVACVRRGVEAGLRDARDWEAMAVRALTVHPEFDCHPDVAALLAERPDDVGFARLVMDFTEADWRRIAREAPLRRASPI